MKLISMPACSVSAGTNGPRWHGNHYYAVSLPALLINLARMGRHRSKSMGVREITKTVATKLDVANPADGCTNNDPGQTGKQV
jgi:hypothetical protein